MTQLFFGRPSVIVDAVLKLCQMSSSTSIHRRCRASTSCDASRRFSDRCLRRAHHYRVTGLRDPSHLVGLYRHFATDHQAPPTVSHAPRHLQQRPGSASQAAFHAGCRLRTGVCDGSGDGSTDWHANHPLHSDLRHWTSIRADVSVLCVGISHNESEFQPAD